MFRSLALSAAAFFGLSAAALACPTFTMTGQGHNVSGPQLQASQQWNVVAGGENNLRNCPQIGINRTGYFITPPDFSFYMSQMEGYDLNVSVQGQCDTTLLLNDPTTQWHFDDDGAGSLQPRITLNQPANGRLDAWVGTYTGEYCNAQIMLQSVQATGIPQPQPQPPIPPVAAACPSWQTPGPQIPVSGPGNTQPLTYAGTASGPILARDCAETGVTSSLYVTEQPTFSIPLSNMEGYTLRISADGGSCDAGLLVNLPDTTWQWNDDFNGLQPQLDITGLTSGRLDVWLARWANDQTCPAQMTIQTIQTGAVGPTPIPQPEPAAACPSWAIAGQQVQVSGPGATFGNSFQTTAGGNTRIGDCPELGMNNSGHVTPSPQYSLMLDQMQGYDLELTVQGQGGCDTVLLANLPNTQWEYNDDGAGSLQPILTLSGLTSGRLDVWVGTWGSNRNCAATFSYRTIPAGGVAPVPTPDPIAACPTWAVPGQQINVSGPAGTGAMTMNGIAGGPTRIGDCPEIGISRSGYFSEQPTYSLMLDQMQGYDLELTMQGQGGCDTVLLANLPNTQWEYDDDGNGNFQPILTISGLTSGRLDVWLGRFGTDTTCQSAFTYRTIPAGGVAPTPTPTPTPQPASACPDPAQTGQMVNLTGDQLYSPQAYQTQANGGTNLRDCGQITYDGFSSGYFTQAPQYSFNLSGMERYRLVADVDSQCDAAMLINSANGTWYFDDDSNGNLDPRLELSSDADLNGRLDVWVGTWNNSPCPATLNLETWLR